MLYEICHIGHAEAHVIFMVIGCDEMMIIFGIVAAFLQRGKSSPLKYIAFSMSCCYYALMLATIQVEVASVSVKKATRETQALFEQLKCFTAILWTLYPIVVLL